MNNKHYHITIGMSLDELRILQNYVRYEFENIAVRVEPDNSEAKDVIKDLLMRVFAVIKNKDLNKIN